MPRAGEFRHVGVATRITLTVVVLGALALAALVARASRIAADDRLDAAAADLRRLATAVEPLAHDALVDDARARALEPRARSLGFTVYDENANPVVPADPERTKNPRIRLVLASRAPHDEVSIGDASAVVVYRAPLLTDAGRLAGAVEMGRVVPLSLPGAWKLLSVAAAILAALAVAVGLYARRAVGRPLRGLLAGVDRVIEGDLGAALPIGRTDEIGELAYRFNEMTARLRDAQAELRRSESRLRHSEKLATVGQIAAEIAHEVGTPLGVIAGRARNVARKSADPAEVEKNAGIIAEQTDRIRRIIQRLLDFARRGSPAREPTDLNDTVRKALAFVEDPIERARVRLDLVPDAALPKLRVSGDEIQQVCLNLVLNAVDAMPRGGSLLVRTGRESRRKEGLELAPPIDYALLEIADTGVGIPEEHRARIFEPFFSTKAEGLGTGLGLAVSLGIVKDHGGFIEVGERPGGGTTFRVYLPLEEVENRQPAVESSEAR